MINKYLYNNFLDNISKKFVKNFEEISTDYNFDNGNEFEIALCKSLRSILPQHYGICRGTIFSKDGNSVGDDIIIYNQIQFPTLRLLEDNTFAQKQQIPYEAVIAYIEAKNTLVIDGDGGNSISKAWSQCQAVKKLIREDVKYSKYSINQIPFMTPPPNWPKIGNPIFTAIFARGIREKSGSKIVDKSKLAHFLLSTKVQQLDQSNSPDLIIADLDVLFVPTIESSLESPFFIPSQSRLLPHVSDKLAYGIGLSLMFYAFDNIRLGKLHWPSIIGNGMNLKSNDF